MKMFENLEDDVEAYYQDFISNHELDLSVSLEEAFREIYNAAFLSGIDYALETTDEEEEEDEITEEE